MAYKDLEKKKATKKAYYSRPDIIKKQKQKKIDNKKRNSEYIKELKEKTPCMDCGKNYPYYVMDFDHVKDKKINGVGRMLQYGFSTLKKEIAKCEIVCANCHRERTQNRL